MALDAEAAAAGQDAARAHAEAAELARARDEVAARRRDEDAVAERARAAAAEELARKEAARREARRAELSEQAVAAAALDDLAGARRQFNLIRREWGSLGPAGADEATIFARYTEADAAFAARDTAAHEADQRARREALTRIQQLLGRIEPLAARTDLTLKAGERALRDVRTALGSLPPLPSKRDHEDILKRLKAAQTAFTPKVQELRDVAGWQRWANVGLQEQLCEKMEALASVMDPEEIARQVRELQQQWKQAADVPRAQGEVLWRRFKTAHDAAWSRCEAYFAEQAEARAVNLAQKMALSDRAEALADSTSWIQTADEIKKLQAEWKTIGPVTRGQEKTIWERFRTACDRFFTRRHADLAERKTMWAENLAKKEALCVAAEALSGSTDWDATASEIKRLQNEWKGIGPVKKTRSEALWQRFRGACDQFFQRYAQRHDIARGERVAAREAICVELEGLAQSSVVSLQSSVAAPSPAESDTASALRVVASTAAEIPESAISHQPSAIPEEPPVDLVGEGARAARTLAAGDCGARRRSRPRRGARRAVCGGVCRRAGTLAGGVRRLGSRSGRQSPEDGSAGAPDGRARRIARRRRWRRRCRLVADDQACGDAERGAGRQHHRRQGGRREQGPRGQRGSASGAGELDAESGRCRTRPGVHSPIVSSARCEGLRTRPHRRRARKVY